VTRRDTDNLGEEDTVRASEGVWPYVGVGCISAVAGVAGGGMIAVLVAKIVGGISRCRPDAETGAPCDWSVYWTWGARIGLVLVPAIVLWRMRKVRVADRHIE
jgi:hypothetical protein